MHSVQRQILTLVVSLAALVATAQVSIDYNAGLLCNAGKGDFAPYYIASNSGGVATSASSGLLRAGAFIPMDYNRRFSFAAGIDLVGGAAKGVDYLTDNGTVSLKPSSFFIQQAYAEVKYRRVFLSVGMKERNSFLHNPRLSSGDFVEGNNARPIPQVRLGFIDFVDVPFTNYWLQIQAEYSFGKSTDSKWLRNHICSRNNLGLTTGWFYSYKRFFFRSDPAMPFSVTVGMQNAVQIGGDYTYLYYGYVENPVAKKLKLTFKSFLHTIIPSSGNAPGNAEYYDGNSIGSWDFLARYRLPSGDCIKAYFQFPFEDGSGIGKLNGFDGVYGIEYSSESRSAVSGAVLEYIDFRNQSGPMHYAAGMVTGAAGLGSATGADDYYNNFQYNGYMHHGMAIGLPFIKSTIYNTDGYMRIADNRIVGFHFGLSGYLSQKVDYRALFSYRRSLGTPIVPAVERRTDTSMLLEANCRDIFTSGLSLNAKIAFDSGTLYGDNFGAMIGINYSGNLSFGK